MIAYRIPFRPGHRMAVIEVRFGHDLTDDLLVDTGAERSVIAPRLAERLGIDASAARGLYLWGVGGPTEAAVARLDRIAIGAVVLPEPEVIIADIPSILRVRGLIGLDVLRRFRVTFEFDTRTLVLRQA